MKLVKGEEMRDEIMKEIYDQLRKIPSGQGGIVRILRAGIRVELQLADWDRLGCLIKRFRLEPTDGRSLELDPAHIERQVTYLGENLRVIEREEKGGKTILRSTCPRNEGETISFFEMVVDREEGLSLVRYAYDRLHAERTAVPVFLTRETLERLIDDLVGMVREE